MHNYSVCPVCILFTLLVLEIAFAEVQHDAVDNFFPSCVVVSDIYPILGSYLKPVKVQDGYDVYSIQITFSKPLLRDRRTLFVLTSVLSTNDTSNIAAFMVKNWRGSQRKVALLFRVRKDITLRVNLVIREGISAELIPDLPSKGISNLNGKYCEQRQSQSARTTMKCYLTGWNKIFVSTILGEFYLSGMSSMNPLPLLRLIKQNPYCIIRSKRPYLKSMVKLGYLLKNSSTYQRGLAYLRANITTTLQQFDDGFTDLVSSSLLHKNLVYIPVTVLEQKSQAIKLPKYLKVKASKRNLNIMVRLSDYSGVKIEIKPAINNGTRLYIPADVKNVYQINERIVFNRSSYRTYDEVPLLIRGAENVVDTISILCPPNSRRNPSHLKGYTRHVLEKGPLYHIIVPHPIATWRHDGSNSPSVSIKAYREINDMNTKEELAVVLANTSNIAKEVAEALRKYVCLLPSSSKLSYTNRTDANHASWMDMDRCIFVPHEVAFSSNCGGLQLFQNIKNLSRNTEDFCQSRFGDCIGMPFSSQRRFPRTKPYGLRKLSGWSVCKNCVRTQSQHSIGKLLYKDLNVNTYSRSVLKQLYVWVQEDMLRKSVISTTIMLRPARTETTELKLLVQIQDGVAILSPQLAVVDEDSEKDCRYMKLSLEESAHSATTANLTATIFNAGEGGGDVTFTLKCSDLLHTHPLSGNIKKWVKPKTNVSVRFFLSSMSVRSLEQAVHDCNMTVTVPRLSDPDIQLYCIKTIATHYGLFRPPCAMPASRLLPVNVVYYVLPKSDNDVITVLKKAESISSYSFLKSISVTLQIHKNNYKQRIVSLRMYSTHIHCNNEHVLVMAEDNLTLLNPSNNPSHRQSGNQLYLDVGATAKKIHFFLTLKTLNSNNQPTLCSLKLIANQPNGYCVQKRITIEELFIPFSGVDLSALEKEMLLSFRNGRMNFLRLVYGWQPLEIVLSLMLGIFLTLLLSIMTGSGLCLKNCFRHKLPATISLAYFEIALKNAMSEQDKFWTNPSAFLQPPAGTEYGPHFILHNFKPNLPLNSQNLSSLKIAGSLKHKGKELPVVIGDILYLFIAKMPRAPAIWVLAASGVYLLKLRNCSPKYRQEMCYFLERNGVRKSLL